MHATIAIHPQPTAACSACLHGRAAPVCRASVGQACAATQFSGPRDEVARVLQALAQRLGFAAEAPELAGVRALRIATGEVELQLAGPRPCGGGAAAFAESAFDALRHLLPDTDIYVTHDDIVPQGVPHGDHAPCAAG